MAINDVDIPAVIAESLSELAEKDSSGSVWCCANLAVVYD
jgi:hypothetical protein